MCTGSLRDALRRGSRRPLPPQARDGVAKWIERIVGLEISLTSCLGQGMENRPNGGRKLLSRG